VRAKNNNENRHLEWSWCAQEKIKKLASIEADSEVVQECEHTEDTRLIDQQWLPNDTWKGSNKYKGLAVFAKEHFVLEELPGVDESLELFLPVKINNIQYITVWTKHANSPTFQYIGQ
jgi:uncharacterized Fe-S cluster-containing protein